MCFSLGTVIFLARWKRKLQIRSDADLMIRDVYVLRLAAFTVMACT